MTATGHTIAEASKPSQQMINVAPIPAPMTPAAYLAKLMRSIRYGTQEQAQLAASQVALLEWLDKDLSDVTHTSPILLIALGRCVLNHGDRDLMRDFCERLPDALERYAGGEKPGGGARNNGGGGGFSIDDVGQPDASA